MPMALVVKVATKEIGIGRVRLAIGIWSDVPYGPYAAAGEYDAVSNRHGAVSVITTDGRLLGVKPDEYEPI